MSEAVILDAVRTPFGRRNGVFRETRPDALLAHALNGLVERTGVEPAAVSDVIAGCVTQAGEQGANIARLAVLLADFPVTVPGVSLNRMCGSSQQAMHFASQAVAAGDAYYAIGCGIENMSRAPMFLDINPDGNFRGFEVLNPALFERHELIHQGQSAELIAERWGISREECDDFAAESHRRAAAARRAGNNREVLPSVGGDADGHAVTVAADEGIRDPVDRARLAELKTVFREGGVVTAGNASQISDGAAAVLVGDLERARVDGIRPRARFLARVAVGDDTKLQLMGVVPATRMALERAGLVMADLDWIEINEAFATVVLGWARELQPDMERVNPWGGAIAHGHPLGATGAGLMAKMLSGLEATGGTLGLQVMCIGHGMATATIIERI
jgi:acetyl-CoA acetyltransferase family protein